VECGLQVYWFCCAVVRGIEQKLRTPPLPFSRTHSTQHRPLTKSCSQAHLRLLLLLLLLLVPVVSQPTGMSVLVPLPPGDPLWSPAVHRLLSCEQDTLQGVWGCLQDAGHN
jgi:hypothetical protein